MCRICRACYELMQSKDAKHYHRVGQRQWRIQGRGDGAIVPPLVHAIFSLYDEKKNEKGLHQNKVGEIRDHARMVKGGVPPCIGRMELLAWMQRADFSEHI